MFAIIRRRRREAAAREYTRALRNRAHALRLCGECWGTGETAAGPCERVLQGRETPLGYLAPPMVARWADHGPY